MEARKPKTLEDLPTFKVAAVRRGKTSDAGYTRFELDGRFDRVIDRIDPHWFWLLFGHQDCICATLESLDKATNGAILSCAERDEPKVDGQTLFYLSPHWQAYNVWTVLDSNWGWERNQFHGVDAVAEDYEADRQL